MLYFSLCLVFCLRCERRLHLELCFWGGTDMSGLPGSLFTRKVVK